jgi:hypothetical protein
MRRRFHKAGKVAKAQRKDRMIRMGVRKELEAESDG